MKTSIFGIGYVGAVTAACLAKDGHHVIAVDTDPVKVMCLAKGRSPIVEKDLGDYLAEGVKAGRIKATLSAAEAIENSDMSLICVGTPSRADGSLDLSYVEAVCREIGTLLKSKSAYHTIVLRSTMVPGSAHGVCKPALEKSSGKKAGEGFGFGNNPEFLRESSAIFDYYHPPKIVVGADDDKTASLIMSIYDGIDAPRVTTEIAIAEGVKYADNAWHAMKVGFANEMGNILKAHGVDSHQVMDIFCLDTKLNISKAYLKPGFAFGGSCLPKDVRAIRAAANSKNIKTPIFDALLEANELQVNRAVSMIDKIGSKKIALLGLSFKAGTDDLRESPLVTLANHLLNKGYDLKIYDPNIWHAREQEGANQKYIKEKLSHISSCLVEKSDDMKGSDVFVIGNPTKDFATIVMTLTNDNTPVIDLVRLNPDLEKRAGYDGICW
ncbi:MAG: UDP-glucose/GDP-mannose dehydrogenase family protein [Alphaproteobacteria bacterium]|nr:UDP-glucose/GDP-mannose dehydrogenase family protein [Alphaproteobacteria bacterium]